MIRRDALRWDAPRPVPSGLPWVQNVFPRFAEMSGTPLLSITTVVTKTGHSVGTTRVLGKITWRDKCLNDNDQVLPLGFTR
ncbi:hypothetical protein [Pseudomonas sp. S2_E01]